MSAGATRIPLEGTEAAIFPFRVCELEMDFARDLDLLTHWGAGSSVSRGRRRHRWFARKSDHPLLQKRLSSESDIQQEPVLVTACVSSVVTSSESEDVEVANEEFSQEDPGYDAGDDDEEEEHGINDGRGCVVQPLCIRIDPCGSPHNHDVQSHASDEDSGYCTAAEHLRPESEDDSSSIFSHESLLARMSDATRNLEKRIAGRTSLQSPPPTFNDGQKIPMFDSSDSDRA
ncbi:hypothetical protein BBP40_005144 [Aspergillus hancockii]|nr:hypothetical protein BBP40_005144 [Aspergillus hancockii]